MVVDELFSQAGDDFVEHLRQISSPKYLAGMAVRWSKDSRAWAREQILEYLEHPFDRPGHHPIVKRLFKKAEAENDLELMGSFLVAFDRLVRRVRLTRQRYNFSTRQFQSTEILYSPRDQIMPTPSEHAERFASPSMKRRRTPRLFSYRTRRYLQRRAWRFFRKMGRKNPEEYLQSVAKVLMAYRDEDLKSGENLLDSWSLMNLAFRGSSILEFSHSHINLADERSLSELTAAPYLEETWSRPGAMGTLIKVVTEGKSRLARVWGIQLLDRYHSDSMRSLTGEQLLSLLNHHDEEVQQLGAKLIANHEASAHWPVATWLELLRTRNPAVVSAICDAVRHRVNPERLDLIQCMEVATLRSTPVAQLGLDWLLSRTIRNPEQRKVIEKLADAECTALGKKIAGYGLSILGSDDVYQTDGVTSFFDSTNSEVRRGALEWLSGDSPGRRDPELWCRLMESPYDDVRMRLIEELQTSLHHTRLNSILVNQDFEAMWKTVLLNIHRGGRAKLKALRQVSQAIIEDVYRADRLIPLLVIAIRSVRPAETRAGLSAILTAISSRPELEAVLSKEIPELELLPPTGMGVTT